MPESNTESEQLQVRGGDPCRPDLSVIVVTWNVRLVLEPCLDALRSPEVREDLTLEVIVVDNASTDGTADWARLQHDVRVVPMARNLGYGRANNIGLRLATGKRLLVLNPDTIPLPGSLTELVQFAKIHPKAGISSPRLFNKDRSFQPAAFRFPTLIMHALDLFPPNFVPVGRVRIWLLGSLVNGRYKNESNPGEPFRIDHPLGASMLLSRTAYEEVGGFDPKIFMYSEEIDLALRYRRAGWACWQVPSAQVVHLGGASTAQMPGSMRLELWRSRFYLYRKHYTKLSQVALSGLVLTKQAFHLLKLAFRAMLRRTVNHKMRAELEHIRQMARLALGR